MATSDYFQRGPASVAAGATASPARGTPSSTQAPQALASAGSRFVLRQVKLPPSVPLPKRYFLAKSLAELVMTYAPHEKAMATIGDARPAAVLTPSESQSRETFLDFVYGLLQVPGHVVGQRLSLVLLFWFVFLSLLSFETGCRPVARNAAAVESSLWLTAQGCVDLWSCTRRWIR